MTENLQREKRTFQLRPFTAGELTGKLSVSGSCARFSDTLVIDYRVLGALENVNRPAVLPLPRRCHELWRHTCFELFFGIKGGAEYWEINVSPGGGWNIYHFTGYRAGMREETSIGQPLCRVASTTDFLTLQCTIRLNTLIDDYSELEIGVSSVIETTDGALSYWAIKHPGNRPDFHHRGGFLIALSGSNGSI